MIITKINNNYNNSSKQQQQNDVLTPTSVYNVKQFHNSQSIIDQFDPLLAQSDLIENCVRIATSSSIPSSIEKLKYDIDDVTNNNNSIKNRNRKKSNSDLTDGGVSSSSPTNNRSNRNSYHNVHNEPINLLQIEERTVKYSDDLQYYLDHLRALYTSICSKGKFSLSNSGLVWSARIDVTNIVPPPPIDTYMCSPSVQIQKTQNLLSLNNNNNINYNNSDSAQNSQLELCSTSAIFDVRFNSLVHAKLAGAPIPNVDAILKSDTVWYLRKVNCSIDNSVEMIINEISINIERNETTPEVSHVNCKCLVLLSLFLLFICIY